MPLDLSNTALDRDVVGRAESFFAADLEAQRASLAEQIRGARILVIGGAGSIGSRTLATVADFAPRCLHVIDHNENGLAELVRSIRSAGRPFPVEDLTTLPFDYGGVPFALWFAERAGDYDHILNFAALKHVRSEKDPYSILAMLETNVAHLAGLARMVARSSALKRVFCVSTDKAANPSSMMGATKRMMEHALFSPALGWPRGAGITSARFANVAFSNGSLLQSWQIRLAERQPMACPEGCRRFFVSLPESGHLCTLAAFATEPGSIAVPSLDPASHLVLLQDVAARFLAARGLAPVFVRSESEALKRLEPLSREGRWPVLLTPLDTAGEKPYEEFVAAGEEAVPTTMASLLRVSYVPPRDPGAFPAFLDWLEAVLARGPGGRGLSIADIKAAIGSVEAGFLRSHVASERSLDHRM